ncbi:MAG: iron-containing alcohol dehydrogenase [Pseudomonadota bacterium]
MQSFDAGRVPSLSFGPGRLLDLPDRITDLGGGPVLVVADAVLAELGVTERLRGILAADGIEAVIAADISGEPKDVLVDAFAARARGTGCKTVIGLGGGAAMDAAKLAAAITLSNQPANYYALAANPLPANRLPSIAIPTTAGTGSEVTRTSIVSNGDGVKLWYWGEELLFEHAVLDPELTVSLPSHVTAWTGADAVAHALEAVTSRSINPVGRLFGLQALEILGKALPKAVADGSDVDVRGQMLWGSTVAGMALHNCNTHMGHNISHALGSLAPVHHGLATGLALEVSLPMLTSRPEGAGDYAAAAKALGGPEDPASLLPVFIDLLRACGIERYLPAEAADVEARALAEQMAIPYNRGMADNAACDISDEDLDLLAAEMMALPVAA